MPDDTPTIEHARIELDPPRVAPRVTISVPPPTMAIVALVLAIALAASLVAFSIGAVIALDSEHLTLSDSAIAFLTTISGAIVGILGTYLGVARGHELANGNTTTTNGATTDEHA